MKKMFQKTLYALATVATLAAPLKAEKPLQSYLHQYNQATQSRSLRNTEQELILERYQHPEQHLQAPYNQEQDQKALERMITDNAEKATQSWLRSLVSKNNDRTQKPKRTSFLRRVHPTITKEGQLGIQYTHPLEPHTRLKIRTQQPSLHENYNLSSSLIREKDHRRIELQGKYDTATKKWDTGINVMFKW